MKVDRRSFRGEAARAAIGLVLGSVAPGCVQRSDELGATGSETHFLIECSETCAAGLDCIGGACTLPCASDDVCAGWSSEAVCVAQPGAPELGVCDVQCSVAADCASLGAGYRCAAGACRSVPSVGTNSVEKRVPETFEVLELRRMLTRDPDIGSNCDPTDLNVAYFVDLAARRVSWMRCETEYRSNIWLRLTGSWTMDDAARDELLTAYNQLQGGMSESCFGGGGGTFVDITTAEARYSYGDESFVPCNVERIGRIPIANMHPLYEALVTLSADSYIESTREGSSTP